MSDSMVKYENGYIIFFDDINTVVPQETYRERIAHIIVYITVLKETQEHVDILSYNILGENGKILHEERSNLPDCLYTEESEIKQEIATKCCVKEYQVRVEWLA